MPDAAAPVDTRSKAAVILAEKRAEIAERVRVARMEKISAAKAEAKALRMAEQKAAQERKGLQAQVLYEDHMEFLPKGMSKQQKEAQRQFKAERQGKVKGYRAQANYGETKFRKP